MRHSGALFPSLSRLVPQSSAVSLVSDVSGNNADICCSVFDVLSFLSPLSSALLAGRLTLEGFISLVFSSFR